MRYTTNSKVCQVEDPCEVIRMYIWGEIGLFHPVSRGIDLASREKSYALDRRVRREGMIPFRV